MEVIVGEEDAAVGHEQQIDDTEIKTFMPIAWAAAYGRYSNNSSWWQAIAKCLGLFFGG